jgi:hypothetical protein
MLNNEETNSNQGENSDEIGRYLANLMAETTHTEFLELGPDAFQSKFADCYYSHSKVRDLEGKSYDELLSDTTFGPLLRHYRRSVRSNPGLCYMPEDFKKSIAAMRRGHTQGVHSALVALGYYRGLCVDPAALEKWALESEIDPDEDISLF